MNPIEKFIEYRLDKLCIEFDLKLGSNFYVQRTKWEKKKREFIELKYSMNYDMFDYIFFRNILWKNIITYELLVRNNKSNSCIATALYTQEKFSFDFYFYGSTHRQDLLNKHTCYRSIIKDNFNEMHKLIIKYYIFIDHIMIHNTITDISNIVKEYYYDLMLIKN